MNIVITYRHDGNTKYPPLIELAFKSAKKHGYKTILVGSDGFESDDHLPVAKSPRLELCEWILFAQEAYLKSDLFNEDTVFFSPDTLIVKSLDSVFRRKFDWAVTERPSMKDKINNGVMFVKPENKDKLIECWGLMRQIASGYEARLKAWYADQRAVNEILAGNPPCGLNILRLPCKTYNASPDKDGGNIALKHAYILHFKGLRKEMMEKYVE